MRLLEARGDTSGIDAIVVLGCPLAPDGGLSTTLRERVEAAVDLHRRGVCDLVVMTGGATRPGLPAEADAMRRAAIAAGVPAQRVIAETESMTTVANAARCAELLLPARGRIALVSQPFHLRRARRIFRAAGFDAQAYRIPHSIQDRDPWLAARWGTREAAAWVHQGLMEMAAVISAVSRNRP